MELNIVKCKTEKYDVFVIADDEFVGYTVRTTGKFWEEWIKDEVVKYYKPGTDILDIGANIGTHSLMFSEIGPVHAFEPVYHEIVKLNIENNTLKNPVKIYPFGLSDKNETFNFYLPKLMPYGAKNYGGTSIHKNATCEHEENPILCDCHRLDDVYNGVPSIMKMDVEDHEMYVLSGAMNTIQKYKPTIITEITDYENSEVGNFIEQMGYDKPIKFKDGVYIYTYVHTSSPKTV
jgi:FkbM family methyltransferase